MDKFSSEILFMGIFFRHFGRPLIWNLVNKQKNIVYIHIYILWDKVFTLNKEVENKINLILDV